MKRSLFFPSLLVLSSAGFADYSFDLRTEVEQIENINRSATDPTDDTRVSYGGNLVVSDSGANSSVDLTYDMERAEYLDDTFDTRTQTQGTGSLWVFNSNRTLNAFVENTLTETAIDVFSPEAGDNLNRISTTSAGVVARARLSGRDWLSLNGTKFWVRSEDQLSDSESEMAELSWVRQISSRSTFGLKGSHTNTIPGTPDTDDFATQRWAATATRRLRTGNLLVEYGQAYSDAEHYDGGDVGEFDEYRLTLSTGIGNGNFTFDGGRELVSSGMGQMGGSSFTPSGQSQFELNLRDYYQARLGFPLVPKRIDFSLYGELSDNDNQLSPNFSYIKSAGAAMNFVLRTGTISLDAARIDREEGDGITDVREQSELRYSIYYGSDIGENINWRCGFVRTDFGEDVVQKSVLCGLNVSVF
ncbi:hypothetical protein SAMN02745866_04043 [Alteromonadaceae bacterium Bs31]|nr:hypothetical protein SAMN02745866_04043 [Alteromonadaceae bacterium Bs31]